MDVSQAVETRRSIRAFLPDAIDRTVIERVLEKAQRSPSGGNTQPWHAVVIAGEPLKRLVAETAKVIPEGTKSHAPEYNIYPPELDGAYAERRFGVGEAMYAALNIPREDKKGRLSRFMANFRAFDAPVLMLVHTPRYMGPPQWSDIGMWLQTVMLLLREEGLDSCAQEAWAIYQKQIRACVDIPEDHVFFCGLSIGKRDESDPINAFPVPRAPLSEAVRFEGF
ncbi:nitroreductase [Novosphingobium olei]|uniref:Nitroreductase n=1 Tax=Novosphingobium olei TaxID=2728851 RepID=A0A7Y0BLL9_9SPHN|nr:nitroreductase [Novosphingobium olei]NML92727.1 nitroreductase [Novosphingobium olei]